MQLGGELRNTELPKKAGRVITVDRRMLGITASQCLLSRMYGGCCESYSIALEFRVCNLV